MDIVNFVYNDQQIDFEPMGKDDIMVNATQMAKIFGKRVDNFLRLDQVKEFIEIMQLTHFRVSSENEIPQNGVISRDKIIRGENGNATFFHRILALKFAAWLDPKFELWIFITIDKILNEYYRNQRERKVQRESIKAMMEKEKTPKFIELEKQLRAIDNESKVETRKEVKRIQMELIFD